MALSKTISDRGSHGHHTFTLTVTETAVNNTANTSTCSIKFTISPYQTGYNWEDFTGSEKPKGTVTFNGTSYSWDLPNYNGKSTVTLVSKTGITVKHGSDGKKTVSFSFSCSSGSTSYLPGSASGSGSLALTAIPRVPTVTQKVSSKTETSITMTWSSDLTIDTIRYSTNGGSSWTSKNVTDGKSGSYTVSGLSANTSYSMKTELHSKESGLSGQSSALSVKTYAWPYAIGSDQYVYRDGVFDVTFKNPLERNVSYVIKVGDTVISQGETDGEGVMLYDYAEDFLTLIPNSNTGTYTVTVTYSGHTATATGTFYATGANPTITSVVYQDTNNTAQAIIQDNQIILQNIGRPRITATGTGQFGATIASGFAVILGAQTTLTKSGDAVVGTAGVIDSATDVTAQVTIVDTRGNTATKTITITMAAYTLPSALIDLARKNNFYSLTDIKVNADVMPLGSNAPTITARWRIKGTETWSDPQTLQDNVLTALNGSTGLDNTEAWDIQVTIVDSFGGTVIYNTDVGVGLPIAFFDRLLRAFGINCFPKPGQPLAVDGVDILGELFYKPGDKLSIDGTGTGGAPFTGYVTASTTTIRFMVPVGKSLANITTITCNVCTGGIRGISGYVDGSRDNTDWTSGYTITCTKPTNKIVQVEIKKSSAFSNVTNNTPIAYAAANFELEFS